MVKHSQKIDDVFRNELGGIEMEPSAAVWSKIETDLNSRGKRRGVIIMWGMVAAASVVLAIVGVLTYQQGNTGQIPTTLIGEASIVRQPQEMILEKEVIDEKKSDNKLSDQIIVGSSDLYALRNEDVTEELERKIDDRNEIQTFFVNLLKGNGVGQIDEFQEVNSRQLRDNRKKEYLSLYAYNDVKPSNKIRILVGGAVSSDYSYRESSGAPKRAYSAYTYEEKGINTVGGGVNIRIEGRSRWSIETGVIYNQIGQEINSNANYQSEMLYGDAYIRNTVGFQKDFSNSLGRVRFNSTKGTTPSAGLQYEAYSMDYSNSMLTEADGIRQALDYIEVPLLARYKVIDGFPVVSIAGGVSSNFLVGNSAYLIDENTRVDIGDTEGIKSMSWSGSLGIGIEVPVNKFMRISLEPKVKYYLESINQSSVYNYQPYSFAVSGGLTFILK